MMKGRTHLGTMYARTRTDHTTELTAHRSMHEPTKYTPLYLSHQYTVVYVRYLVCDFVAAAPLPACTIQQVFKPTRLLSHKGRVGHHACYTVSATFQLISNLLNINSSLVRQYEPRLHVWLHVSAILTFTNNRNL
jgi:hypothetical protein